MEIREDFIKNDIGIIPKDWEIKNIGSICEIYGRIGYRGYTIKDIMPQGEGAITISPSNIQDGKTDFSKCTYISWFKYDESPEIKIFNGDILLVKTGSTYGKTAIIKNLFEKATINPQLVVLKNIKVDNVFLGYMMAYKIIQNQIKSTIVGGAIPTLSQQLVANYKVPLPSTKLEQNAISTALSDADALISSLERIIEKKRNIKQGAMQQLLKPKRDWIEKKLGDFLDYEQPTDYLVSDTEYDDFNQTPVLTAGKTFILGYTNEIHGIFNKLPVIIFDDFTTAIKYVTFPFKAKSSAMKMLIPKNSNVNLRFIFELMLQIKYLPGDHKRHWIGEYRQKEIMVPSSEKEQNEISTILTDMDNEIDLLEKKLSKSKLIKQGMMQNLLTGKIRLV
jgi:type I restriction enzyme S subunit